MKHIVTTKQTKLVTVFIVSFLMLSCKRQADPIPAPASRIQTDFISFNTNGQTLSTFIHPTTRQVRLEIGHDVDITRLVANFKLPDGATVKINGVAQTSGTSTVNFSNPVIYQVANQSGDTTNWEVSVIPVKCKILIDASHDGGVWWFPQSEATGFDTAKPHQGKAFADVLRKKGFAVSELGRGKELTEEMFFGHYIVIRAGFFGSYSNKELDVYRKLLDRGMNLVHFTEYKRGNSSVDGLDNLLGLKFEGIARGVISTFTPHEITANLNSIPYAVGSVITNAAQNPNIQLLGWLDKNDYADLNDNGVKDGNEPLAPPVMGILTYPKSKVFFMGDVNTLEFQPQPFIDNLIKWMGHCF